MFISFLMPSHRGFHSFSWWYSIHQKTKMQTLPPPPPYIPSSIKQSKPSPFHQIPFYSNKDSRSREAPILRQPKKTKPIIWFAAVLCLIMCLLIIFFGIATLIIFLTIKPRTPEFDTPGASLSVIYFNSPQFLNGDLTFLANFSNPNRKLNVKFEYLQFELYFSERLIAAQVVQPFSQRAGEVRLMPVHLMSSLVYLPPNLALELSKQAQRNRVVYKIKAKFRVRVKFGIFNYSYWLHGTCQLEMTSPPTGILVAHSCRTKR